MISFKEKGNWTKTVDFLNKLRSSRVDKALHEIGELGVKELQKASPVNTGLLSRSWYYVLKKKPGLYTVEWHNSDIEDGQNIAILVQSGHRTSGGYYVRPNDFITPALEPIFKDLAEKLYKEVTA